MTFLETFKAEYDSARTQTMSRMLLVKCMQCGRTLLRYHELSAPGEFSEAGLAVGKTFKGRGAVPCPSAYTGLLHLHGGSVPRLGFGQGP